MHRLTLYELELAGYFKLIDYDHNGKPGIEIYPQDIWFKITSCWKASGFTLTVGNRKIECNKQALQDFLSRYKGKEIDIDSYTNEKIMKIIYQVENRARRRTKGLGEFLNHRTPFRHSLREQAQSVQRAQTVNYGRDIVTLVQIYSRRTPLCELICDPTVERAAAKDAARILLAKISGANSSLSDKKYKRTTDLLKESIAFQVQGRADAAALQSLVNRLITNGR